MCTNHYYISICLNIFQEVQDKYWSWWWWCISECSLDSVRIKDNYTSCSLLPFWLLLPSCGRTWAILPSIGHSWTATFDPNWVLKLDRVSFKSSARCKFLNWKQLGLPMDMLWRWKDRKLMHIILTLLA